MAAYLDKNAKPMKIPNKIKFFVLAFFSIFTNSFNESVQNSNKNISVLITNEEKVTAGINKKINAQEKELSLSNPMFLLNL